jgi:hypothetical protein
MLLLSGGLMSGYGFERGDGGMKLFTSFADLKGARLLKK